jgi:PBS lyase HEAT-like repeat
MGTVEREWDSPCGTRQSAINDPSTDFLDSLPIVCHIFRMEKKRAIGLGVMLLVIAGGLSWEIWRTREPMYEGKPLSYWLDCYTPLNRTETSFQQAEHALQAIGTNAIPTLLRMLQKKDSPLKLRCVELLQKQHLIKVKWPLASEQIGEAMIGFSALQSDAKQAAPALIKIYNKNISEDSRTAVIYALQEIHSDPNLVVPVYVKALHESGMVRINAAFALRRLGTKATNAIPDLMALATGPDPAFRLFWVNTLEEIDPKSAAQFETETSTNH